MPRLVGEKLETAIDLRLHDLWGDSIDFPDVDLEVLGVFMRNAYALGYIDAVKDGGAFMRDELGYPLPRVETGRGQAGGPQPAAGADLPRPVSPYDWAIEEVAQVPKIQPYRDEGGEYRWRRIAENGNVIADSGEGYVNKRDCLEMAKANFPDDPFDWALLPDPDALIDGVNYRSDEDGNEL